MATATQEEVSIVFCHCAYTRLLPTAVKQEVYDRLQRSGTAFEEVEDLCKLAAEGDAKLSQIATGKQVKIAACYPRAVKWLFHAGGTPLNDEKTEILNMREQDAETVAQGLLGENTPQAIEAVPEPLQPAGPWKPWFPVIDFDRCTNCMQCLSFCLFDVYAVNTAKSIQVANPTKCKTDCPACSRVCPEAAIMFPKYRAAPINGAEVSEQDLSREKMKVDITSLLGGDIYSILKDRTARAKSRFSKERDDERALKERKRCLKKLKEGLDIPDEVLSALPSLDDIQKKAAQATLNNEIGGNSHGDN